MRNITYCCFLLFLAFFHSFRLSAQSELRERRAGLLAAISLIEDYERKSRIVDAKSVSSFKQLFVNEKTMIYNDLLGLSTETRLTVDEYARLQSEGTKLPSITIMNVKNDAVEFDGKMWHIHCSFDKKIAYYDTCGIRLESEKIYNKNHKIKTSIVYDPLTASCLFESIDGSLDTRPVSIDYKVFKASHAHDNKLLYNGKKLDFDIDDNSVFFPYGIDYSGFEFKDPDVVTNLIEDNAHTVHMQYSSLRWRISPYYNVTLGDYYSISMSSDNMLTESSGKEFGVNIGYTFPSQSKFKISLNSGVACTFTNVSISASACNFKYQASKEADVDNDSYERYYEYEGGHEKIGMGFIAIPLFLDFDLRFNKYFSAYAQVGVRNYLNTTTKLTDYSASAYVYGVYPQYDNLRLDEKWGYNGFGYHVFDKSNITDSEIPVKTISIDAMGVLGLRISPIRKIPQLALDLGVQYQAPITSMWDERKNGLSFEKNNKEHLSVLSYSVASGEKVRMLSEGIKDMKRQNVSLKIGLMYKF